MGKIAYVGLFLDRPDYHEVLQECPPKHPNLYAHHCTLQLSPATLNEVLRGMLGLSFRLPGVREVWDDKGQALEVTLPPVFRSFFPQGGKIPHVTLSCAVGVKPAYSNTLLASPANEAPTKAVIREARLGVFDGSRIHYTWDN